jgi:hypothetical protein
LVSIPALSNASIRKLRKSCSLEPFLNRVFPKSELRFASPS